MISSVPCKPCALTASKVGYSHDFSSPTKFRHHPRQFNTEHTYNVVGPRLRKRWTAAVRMTSQLHAPEDAEDLAQETFLRLPPPGSGRGGRAPTTRSADIFGLGQYQPVG